MVQVLKEKVPGRVAAQVVAEKRIKMKKPRAVPEETVKTVVSAKDKKWGNQVNKILL
jgi:hypothetical protein